MMVRLVGGRGKRRGLLDKGLRNRTGRIVEIVYIFAVGLDVSSIWPF